MSYRPLSVDVIDTLQHSVIRPGDLWTLKEQCRRANACIDWMRANIPELECRGDEDCDHCVGVALLVEYLGEEETT